MNNEINSRISSIKEGKVPLGYKKSKVGIIPNDWEEKSLSELIEELETGVSVNSYDFKAKTGEKAVLKTSCVSNGKFDPYENKLIIEKEIDRAKLNPKSGEIIISRMNTPQLVGEIGYIEKDYPELFLPDRLWQSKLNKGVDGRWLAECLITEKIKYQIKDIATGTSNSMKNISKTSFLSLKIPFTIYEEQKKISDILNLWNKKIELKEKLLIEKQKQKKGLIERFLTGKVRLNGFNDKVEIKKLKDYISEIKVKNKDNKERRILSVTNRQGFILQEEKFDRIIASNDLSNYKIVKKGQFAYNPSRVNVGSLDLLTNFDSGLLSPMYVIFECNDDLDKDYLYQFLKSNLFLKYIPRLLQGSVRDSLSFEALQQVRIFIPKVEEQKSIANILKTSDKEIKLLSKEIELLKEQKKGLMQLLLTGIVRV
ncbi:TPA: restriction endonuclease subunit S [Clostridioides difficile]|uniref:restriction endonuclease subunit S n=1 Tax=Clostridioides difficile TaxID=1496 RepID=UPI00097FE3E4|nr:restriction endonuclease subunit S [Clostridioides difficile]AXU29203.1 restriction modification system DNA specificity domain-containing protein [Clostridioides difficile]AXU32991.1 restriction modification system DNA specificity domain-containing protein [Clostridioides difficile]AXU36779.1 restriction modification system DNA specificity domain-containing protein [Clostridioides difficile]MCP8413132.1 restriction endonuclease subunit S [Clostridioides difficile]MDC9390867.1 restriction en